MLLLYETHSALLALLLQVQWKLQTEESRWRCWNVFLNACYGQAKFVDLGTGTLGSSMYLLYFLMRYPPFIKMRVKDDL